MLVLVTISCCTTMLNKNIRITRSRDLRESSRACHQTFSCTVPRGSLHLNFLYALVAMSSDFNPTLADETLMHSPPREDTDDTIARLYFGPQQSPEKRLIKSLLRQDDDTPRRRSARLSSPAAIHSPSPLPPYVAQQHVDTDQLEKYDSGRDTPDNNQDIQDGGLFVCLIRVN